MQPLALTEEFASLGNQDTLPIVCAPISELCGSWVPKSKITLPSDTLPKFKASLGDLKRLTQYKIVDGLERLLSGLVGGSPVFGPSDPECLTDFSVQPEL